MTKAQEKRDEFREIANCGGQFTVRVTTSEDGHRAIQLGIRHSNPNPAAFFAVYALPSGMPVGMIHLGGMGQAWNAPPVPGCLSIFVGSDKEGKFGHRCPYCRGYWRSNGAPAAWDMTCPYCGSKASAHFFLTPGQVEYIQECCRRIDEVTSQEDGMYAVDMDAVAKDIAANKPAPAFYYKEETQQNKFICDACRAYNDILGRYGSCSHCGTYNGLAELRRDIDGLRAQISTGSEYESYAKSLVSAFDSNARQVARQLAHRVPMSPRRVKEWKRKLFHNLDESARDLKEVFDISLRKGIEPGDWAFATTLFHRRHVYEHNGGEADEKYIQDSGDTSVRPKQLLRETRESVSRLSDLIVRLGENLSNGFHEIFPGDKSAIRALAPRAAR
jgi:hypothetical protein